jgi:hypothetical protein
MAIDLDAVQARVDAATKGPWIIGFSMGAPLCLHTEPPPASAAEWAHREWARDPRNTICTFGPPRHQQNADFIAHAYTDVPVLVAELRAARDERDTARALVALLRQLQSAKEKAPP